MGTIPLTSKTAVEAAYYGEGFAGEIDAGTDLPVSITNR